MDFCLKQTWMGGWKPTNAVRFLNATTYIIYMIKFTNVTNDLLLYRPAAELFRVVCILAGVLCSLGGGA